jgi:signal transduction histidine kinase
MPQRDDRRRTRRSVTAPGSRPTSGAPPTGSRTKASRTSAPKSASAQRTGKAARQEVAEKPGAIPDRFFRQLVFSLRNGVLVITRDGRVAAANGEAYRIFKLKRNRPVIGRPFSEILKAHPDVVRILASAFELRNLPNRAELRLRSSKKVIGYTLSHVSDERGRHTGVALFFKDLTRVEQLEERERLRDRLAALGEMAAAIAHEVKNPLAGIEVMAGVLRRQVSALPDAQAILTDIINEAKMANAIVHEALEFVRPIRLQVEQTAIAEVLQSSITLATRKLPERAVHVTLDVGPSLPMIDGDQHQLIQVFTNLLMNAFEALNGAGLVTVTAHEETQDEDHAHAESPIPQRSVVVDVIDDGPGVPRELRDRIYNAFFTTKPQGSGLGLAIVRKIVDAHDGSIDLASTPGRGTRFTITLPVSSSETDGWFR